MTPEQRSLLEWGQRHRRNLPWRTTRDPWEVLLAEVMLQQTQVDRAIPRWIEFCKRWPTATAFADAAPAEILAAWQGMGYPRRALNLHRTAQLVVTHHGGELPCDLAALLELPGIGSYTARAVLAFAFEVDAAVVDTNVGRTLARRAGERLSPAVAQRVADEWLPSGAAWEWNQTLLDLGALVCRPQPNCAVCPVHNGCAWRGSEEITDPAQRSAGVSRPQARFDGSLRQARGAVMAALRDGPVHAADLVEPPGHDLVDVLASLEADGLVHRAGEFVTLGPAPS